MCLYLCGWRQMLPLSVTRAVCVLGSRGFTRQGTPAGTDTFSDEAELAISTCVQAPGQSMQDAGPSLPCPIFLVFRLTGTNKWRQQTIPDSTLSLICYWIPENCIPLLKEFHKQITQK